LYYDLPNIQQLGAFVLQEPKADTKEKRSNQKLQDYLAVVANVKESHLGDASNFLNGR
jgi:hypothetical protein